jgi:hypothetical protein
MAAAVLKFSNITIINSGLHQNFGPLPRGLKN